MLQQTQAVPGGPGLPGASSTGSPTPAACAAVAAGRRAPGLGGARLQPPGPGAPRRGRRRGGPARGRGPRRRWPTCWPCPAWGPTRPGPCWPSPSRPTSGVVDTNAGRVLARAVAGRPAGCRRGPGLVDAMVPPGRRVGLQPGAARPGSRGLRGRRPPVRVVPRPAAGAGGRGRGARRPTRPGARPGCRRPRRRSPGRIGRGGDGWSTPSGGVRSTPPGCRPPWAGTASPNGWPAWSTAWWPRAWSSGTGPGRSPCRRGRRWAAGGQVAGPAGRSPVSRAG